MDNYLKRISRQVEALRHEYPTALPQRLAWLCDNLAIGKERMLRLMGFTAQEAKHRHNLSWEELVQRWPEQAFGVESLLHHLMHLYQYDWPLLAGCFHQKNGAGVVPGDQMPYPPEQLEELLEHIVQGGPATFGQTFASLAGRPIPTRPTP